VTTLPLKLFRVVPLKVEIAPHAGCVRNALMDSSDGRLVATLMKKQSSADALLRWPASLVCTSSAGIIVMKARRDGQPLETKTR
jgi:hypothetical protein